METDCLCKGKSTRRPRTEETVDRVRQSFLGVSSGFHANFHHSLHTEYLEKIKKNQSATRDMLVRIWMEMEYSLDICRVTKDAHIESL
ncbi:hypothetical protein TNCV_1011851 [Trichonephila clavipes]|uniref:Uncharacterized protein n=1 Tax=Trichonephila clavipes TaxID=2585209 RepID=A0A8X6VXB3_TRICX|nr:hypothetical protein TNCV_1011851 [Trichonephila clavipes]